MDSTYNPYQPPQAPLDVAAPAAELVQATRGRRFANFVIDTLCYYLLSAVAGFVYVIYLVVTRGEQALQGEPISTLESYAIGISASLFYYVSLEGLFGRTLGKLITGTRVVREDGAPLTLGTVLKRSLARFIPFEPFSFFGIEETPRGWHDTLSKTLVVRTR